MAGPQKTEYRVTVSFSNFISEGNEISKFLNFISKRKKSKESNRYLLTHVHGIIIHNSQKVETSIDR